MPKVRVVAQNVAMSSFAFRLILLVSCAHALVHVFELALPSVEQMIGDEFGVGRDRTGMLGTVWRIPFGVGALFAGWLVDRFGSKPLLLVYLVGCGLSAALAAIAGSLSTVFVAMLAMGCFASIYHPAGLSLISRETNPETRGAALGWHGIFGSLGIAGAPFMAGVAFSSGEVSWRQYYFFLIIPAVILAVLLAARMRESKSVTPTPGVVEELSEQGDWPRFFLLVTAGVLSGFIYAALMHFLPRYLDSAGVVSQKVSAEGARNQLTALVLSFGIVGQAISGKLAKPGRLEWLLVIVFLANVPLLIWMALASGPMRIVATCSLALVHFMNQPLYNSLIAQYVPVARRSTGYGFSNMACFALGGLGPTFAGYAGTDLRTYGGLAVVAGLAAVVALMLCVRRPSGRT